MSILGGVATAIALVTVVIIVTMRLRCGAIRHQTPNHHDHSTWKTDSVENSNGSLDLQPLPPPLPPELGLRTSGRL